MIIAVANQKGGVGKTTTVVNLAACFGKKGYKTLVVDIDPQGNATTGFGVHKNHLKNSSNEVLLEKCDIKDAIVETEFENISILPSTLNLSGCETNLSNMENRFNKLKIALNKVKDDFDFIVIDCPPSIGMLTLNALGASDKILVPMIAEFYALEGLSQLTNTIKIVREKLNPALDLIGILFTMYDNRLNISKDVVEEVEKYFPNRVFKTKIPRNVKLTEAPSYGKPIIYYDKYSSGAAAYKKLCSEILGEDSNPLKKIFSKNKEK